MRGRDVRKVFLRRIDVNGGALRQTELRCIGAFRFNNEGYLPAELR
jgi:hypothetical protein